jgi:hypothetical protein
MVVEELKNSSQSKNDPPILGAETLDVKLAQPLVPPQNVRNEMGKSHHRG